MCYVLFCLVIRTAFFGRRFENIQMDVRRPDVETIEEMVVRNFTIGLCDDGKKFARRYNEMEVFKT